MCLVLAFVLGAFSIALALKGEVISSLVSAILSLAFFILMIRNIIKTKADREGKRKNALSQRSD